MTNSSKHISDSEAKDFTSKHHNCFVDDFIHIQEGKHSDAFSYRADDQNFVIRFNITDEGFLKDKYAFENFSNVIAIPKIIEIGKYNDSLFYCVSEKVKGETVKEKYKQGDFSSLENQFETLEIIKNIPILDDGNFGKWNADFKAEKSFDDYFNEICNGGMFDWSVFENLNYFDKDFVQYLLAQIKTYSSYSRDERVLVHGDFGGSNLLVDEGKISGVIDWAHSFYGDHFWDVGRIVLFCPNKKETTEAALNFYKDKYTNYKERIAWGVYCVMIRNYSVALQIGKEESCLSSKGRIKEIEDILFSELQFS